ncbi:nucleotidyltransferase family protein [Oceanirhabdus sp. W0125-5]|uniref:nucleotidyltransferase family protein n=1 Tax=Oceanirhabdus sp. W0125-5 TaxID=2999116 RepID=UPI0022F2D6FC|nr:nucleotidyltransferase family protein [Oceanirhabdus sp. W0125-5]WBW95438.1 nucleotidyltransferase family protein [Oceanirhabdus sp. W0125-5]
MEKYYVHFQCSIREAMEKISENLTSSAIVVNEDKQVLGMITDGDIRRALLDGKGLESSIEEVFFRNIKHLNYDAGKRKAKEIMLKYKIRQLPVIDEDKKLKKLYFLDDIISYDKKDEWVVIQAGGFGTRLRPLTDTMPKPLLKIGEKPVLEHIIDGFIYFGFRKFIITLNYKGDMIREYFGNGEKYGIRIEYITEDTPLGTAGSLSLCKNIIDSDDIIMVNGDILTGLDYEEFLNFHKEGNNDITVGAREYKVQIPYGVLETEGLTIKKIEEKPKFDFYINSGIYAIKKNIISLINKVEKTDMTEIIERADNVNYKRMVYPIKEYWTDIGRMEDFEKANTEAYKLV